MGAGADVTVDAAGRIMIPKPLRDRLGLRAGSTVTVSEHDGVLELVPRPVDVEIVQRGRVAVLQPRHELPPAGEDEVRAAVERSRR
jgi:AbrB family looped-hinge helix DNA binding protein